MHYYALHSQQRTADECQVSRTHLRRWIAAYERGGLDALEHPQQTMADKTRNTPFIVDKPDSDKTHTELLEELRFFRAQNAYLKKLDALLLQNKATAKKQK